MAPGRASVSHTRGTQSGLGSGWAGRPFETTRTIKALGSCGLTNLEALAAATSRAAQACGIADRKGCS
jgi:imidazolonepropionase-like amidohydrolase